VRMMQINPNTDRPEYLVKSGDRSYIVVDDKKKETPYDEIEGFGYTLDGKLVYQAKNKGSDNTALLINDKVVAEGKDIDLDLAPDGRTIIYSVEDKNKKGYVVVGSKKLEGYERFRRVIFAPDGSGYCIIASKEGKEYLIKNGKEEPMPDNLKGKTLIAMSADGSKIAYEESDGSKYRTVVGDRKSELFDMIMSRSAIFSPDGSKLAFVANVSKTDTATGTTSRTSLPPTKTMSVVVVGDQKSEEFDEIYNVPFGRLSFNSSGSRVAFGARKGNDIWWKVVDVK
jgi:WD40-like Beta Propeller Repeat